MKISHSITYVALFQLACIFAGILAGSQFLNFFATLTEGYEHPQYLFWRDQAWFLTLLPCLWTLSCSVAYHPLRPQRFDLGPALMLVGLLACLLLPIWILFSLFRPLLSLQLGLTGG